MEEAIQGAMDIIAESVADDADYRMYIRKLTMEEGLLVSVAKDEKEKSVYENYYEFIADVTFDRWCDQTFITVSQHFLETRRRIWIFFRDHLLFQITQNTFFRCFYFYGKKFFFFSSINRGIRSR